MLDPLLKIDPRSWQNALCMRLRLSLPRMKNLAFDGGDPEKLDVPPPTILKFSDYSSPRKNDHRLTTQRNRAMSQ